MKEAFSRLLIAAALAVITVSFTEFSLGGFIVLLAVWTAPLQAVLIVQNTIHNRRLKQENQPTAELAVPDTQPLEKP